MTVKLNLGCSNDIRPGFINVDVRPIAGVDVVCDLNVYPWPWADGSVDEIFCAHTLEHLEDRIGAMREMHRILKPGGRLTVIVPNGAGYMAHYPGHRHLFSETWFYAFLDSDDNQDDLTGLFDNIRIELRLFHHCSESAFSKWNLSRLLFVFSRAWERVWNRNRMRQILWETLGVMVPGEVWFAARRRGDVNSSIEKGATV